MTDPTLIRNSVGQYTGHLVVSLGLSSLSLLLACDGLDGLGLKVIPARAGSGWNRTTWLPLGLQS